MIAAAVAAQHQHFPPSCSDPLRLGSHHGGPALRILMDHILEKGKKNDPI